MIPAANIRPSGMFGLTLEWLGQIVSSLATNIVADQSRLEKLPSSVAVKITLLISIFIITGYGISKTAANQHDKFENYVRFGAELDSIRQIAMIPEMSPAIVIDQQIDSTISLAFYKAFDFEPKYNLCDPRIDWERNPQEIIEELQLVDNLEVLSILERQLLSYWRFFQSLGRFDQADRLMVVHTQVFSHTYLDDYPALTEPVPVPVFFIRPPLIAHLIAAIIYLLVTLTWVLGWLVEALVTRFQKKTVITEAVSSLERSVFATC